MSIDVISVETVHSGWAKYLIVAIREADGTIVRREIEHHGAAACVLAYDAERRTAILVRQFRAAVFFEARQEETLEAIAGVIEEPDPADCARREALEEAGVAIPVLEPVAVAWTMPGISTERLHLYLAEYRQADRVADGGGIAHEDERTIAVEMPLADLAAMADTGGLTDLKTIVLVQTLRLRRPELFAGASSISPDHI